MYLDLDTLVVKNIDALFEYDELSATMDLGGTFNTGVFVLRSSRDTLRRMLDVYKTTHSYNHGDQGFLNSFFRPKHIPWHYNIPTKLQEYAVWKKHAEFSVYHFTSETKPWSFHNLGHRHWQRNFHSGMFYEWVRTHQRLLNIPEREVCRAALPYDAAKQFHVSSKFSVVVGTFSRFELLSFTYLNAFLSSDKVGCCCRLSSRAAVSL